MRSIEGQVALVTGAGRGIGRAIALELASMGVRVAAAARTAAELDDTIRAAGSGVALPCDVRERAGIEAAIERTRAALGPIDMLVNAAGIGIFGAVARFSDADYSAVLDTNLRGIFFACRSVLPSMIERQSGHIINIASIAGRVGSANRAVYCASKFAVVGFSESLAEEVREHGIRVSVICPGSTDTGFSAAETRGKAVDRMLQPGDVAHAVRLLVTQEDRSFISEIVIRPTRKP